VPLTGEPTWHEEAPSGLIGQTSLVETATASIDIRSSLPLVRRGHELHVWGGPWIRWANRQDLEKMVFVLDD
jgi:hypothetical protein